jgi:hypothetical protein
MGGRIQIKKGEFTAICHRPGWNWYAIRVRRRMGNALPQPNDLAQFAATAHLLRSMGTNKTASGRSDRMPLAAWPIRGGGPVISPTKNDVNLAGGQPAVPISDRRSHQRIMLAVFDVDSK